MGRFTTRTRQHRTTVATGTRGGPAGRAFQGSDPRGRPEVIAEAVSAELDTPWRSASRYSRRAEVTAVDVVAPTGTVRLRLRVIDGRPFAFDPGQFVGIEADVPGVGPCRSPYCILSAPTGQPVFELLVRLVDGGPLAAHLGSLQPGDTVAFRGPTGRSMAPADPGRDLVLVATGVGIAPFHSLARHLLGTGFDRHVQIFWGLRLAEDICLLDELHALAGAHPNFSYRISLTRPPEGWDGLRGRISESMPPFLPTLGATQFLLCGNGAMIEEVSAALSDVGVADKHIYKEPYFDARHRPDQAVVDAIRARFVANDLFSPYNHQQAGLFDLEHPLSSPSAARVLVGHAPSFPTSGRR